MLAALVAAMTLIGVGRASAQMDYNRDGFITFEDFDAFVGDFVAGEPRSDVTVDHMIDFNDFDTFVSAPGQVNFWFYWMVASREPNRSDMDTETDVGDAPLRRDCFIFYAPQFKYALVQRNATSGLGAADNGLHIMFRKRNTTTPIYDDWYGNWTRWMNDHGTDVQAVVSKQIENPSFAGLVTIDFEEVYPSWEAFKRLAQGDPNGLGIQHTAWMNMLATMHAASWNVSPSPNSRSFNSFIGYTPPLGASKWSDLTTAQKEDLAKKAYNFFAPAFFADTIRAARLARPKAKYGFYNLPMAWYPGLFDAQQADNNALSAIWATSDALYPSMYAKYDTETSPAAGRPYCGQGITAEGNLAWFDVTLKQECARIRDTMGPRDPLTGAATQKILPFVWWRYHDSVVMTPNCPLRASGCELFIYRFLTGVNLDQSIALPKTMGADGLVLWGFLGYNKCTQKYAEDPVELGSEIRTNWAPKMLLQMPIPSLGNRGVDMGPWNDSPPWRGNLGFDGVISPSETRPEVVQHDSAADR